MDAYGIAVRRSRKVKNQSEVPPDAPHQGFVRRYALVLMLAAAAAARAVVALAVPPDSDVYYFLTEGVRTLLSGGNPYDHTYTTIPPDLITVGAEHVFAYLPAALLYLSPFYVAGDVRIGIIAADLVVGACLYFYGGRWRLGAAFIYLFLPFVVLFATVFPNVAVNAMAFIALFLVLESGGRGRCGAVFFGLSLATVQFSFLLLPCVLVYYLRRRRWLEPVVVLVTAAVVTVPFLILSPGPFLNETLFFQFGRSVTPLVAPASLVGFALNPSLSAIALAAFGVTVPFYVKLALELVLVVLFARVTDTSTLTRNAALLVTASAIILPNDFFWSYLELPFMLLLFWLSAPKSLDFVKNS